MARRGKILVAMIAGSVVAGRALLALPSIAAALSDTFRARATLALCADYPFGGVSVELKYRVGTSSTFLPLTILSQNIDSSTNTGTFDFDLPSTLMNTPLQVSAYCRNTAGLGRTSNEKALTNCDYLALLDTDGDGIRNSDEDRDCTNFFSPGDASNPDNLDTDGDGERDLVEKINGFDPTDPGANTRPRIFLSTAFDPDGDGESNPVAWRPSNGTWFIKDGGGTGTNLSISLGQAGDIPFGYQPVDANSDVGIIRRSGTGYTWLFHGPGFKRSDGTFINSLQFGSFGDNVIVGPWEDTGVTSPAVARLFNNSWAFYIYKKDGTIRESRWGGNGDIPMVQDYDGDGLFDVAVYRPGEQKLFIIRSSDGTVRTLAFGSGTADYTVKGDFTGDGKDDLSLWEPISGEFSTLRSDNDFTTSNTQELGLYTVHVPLSWNRRGGRYVYTVVDHQSSTRYFRLENDPTATIQAEQWGLFHDSLG